MGRQARWVGHFAGEEAEGTLRLEGEIVELVEIEEPLVEDGIAGKLVIRLAERA